MINLLVNQMLKMWLIFSLLVDGGDECRYLNIFKLKMRSTLFVK